MRNLGALGNLIRVWANNRKIINPENKYKQAIKLMEEVGELAEGILKNRKEQIKDSIGDIFVVLVILSEDLGLSVENCVNHAYEIIKDRKGETKNGVFIKSEDLK